MIRAVFRVSRLAIATIVVVVASVAGVGCSSDAGVKDTRIGTSSAAIISPQGNATMYSEAVLVQVNNADQDFCTGVLVAPRVVLTASHCVSFNPDDDGPGADGTWTITAPYLVVNSQVVSKTVTASSGEPFDPVFLSLDVNSYDDVDSPYHDMGFIYLDAALSGFTTPSFSATQYPTTTYVQAVGRDAVAPDAHLVLSPKEKFLGVDTGGYANDNRTTEITTGGDSGGPLFIYGTHTLIGTETRFGTENGKNYDWWLNFDSAVVSVIQRMISQHGGAARDPIFDFQEMVSTGLCARAAAQCAAANSSYLASPTTCRNLYSTLGFDATARNLLLSNRTNVVVNDTYAMGQDSSTSPKTQCLTAVGDTTASNSDSTTGDNETQATELANCVAAISGSAVTNASCASSAECAGNAVCQHAANGTATCQPLHGMNASCEVLDKSGTVDQRYDLAQELCSKRGGGATGLYCDGYNFTTDAYKTEATWTCQTAQAAGAACGSDDGCTSNVCSPVDATTAPLTCVASTPFVNSDVCTAFQ